MAWLLQKVGLGGGAVADTFNYSLGEKIGEVGLCDLYAATRKSDGETFSALVFDKVRQGRFAALSASWYANMKRLRHPAIIQFVDGREAADKLCIIVESVRPLRQCLPALRDGHPGAFAWGVHEVGRAIQFINSDCNLVHGFLSLDTVLVTRSGDWKLAGLELISDTSKRDQPLEQFNTLMSDAYKPPELVQQFWINLCKSPRTYDPWLLGCFVSQVFHEQAVFQGENQLKDLTPVPTALRDEYKDLLRPFQRRTMENFLGSRYFKDDYVVSMHFFETIALKDDYEKDQFFKRLQPLIQALPAEVSKYKVLPELVKGLDYGTANFRVLGPILEIGANMTDDEYKRLIGGSVVKWFASQDRSLRRNLLENLGPIIARCDNATVNDKIFGHVADGFEDKSPVLREMTVKAILTLAPKLKPVTLEQDVLKHFARLQLDPEPGIRTNTTICLGKIAEFLPEATRRKILASAFIRALKDHFPPSRLAGVMSLNATAAHYHVQEIAKKIIPALSHMTIDVDPRVREEAFKAIKHFISVLEGQYREMSDEQYVKEATKDTTERTVLDWASNLMGKATSHMTAVAANKVLGTPMPKAAPPPPKYSEDHVRAVAEQVKAEAAKMEGGAGGSAPPSSTGSSGGGKSSSSKGPVKQADGWDDAFDATLDDDGPSSFGAKQQPTSAKQQSQQPLQPQKPLQLQHHTAAPTAAAAPQQSSKVVISDGWGDGDEDSWGDNEDKDDGGWSSLYRPGGSEPAASTSAAPAPVVAPLTKPAVAPAPAPAAASSAAPNKDDRDTKKLPPLYSAPPAAAAASQPPRATLGEMSSAPRPAATTTAAAPAVSSGAFVSPSAFVSTLPSQQAPAQQQPATGFGGAGFAPFAPLTPSPAPVAAAPTASGFGGSQFAAFGGSAPSQPAQPAAATMSGWESFSFANSAQPSSNAGALGGDGWGDLSFLEGKGKTAPAAATAAGTPDDKSKKKSSKKTKK